MAKQTYHHGNLRRVLLDAAAVVIGERGPAALSLRELARRAGVTHAAPTHHFSDKAGLLTALATEGFALLTAELTREWAASHSLQELGVTYVRFAIGHRAHFEIMFRPELYRTDDPALLAARAAFHTTVKFSPQRTPDPFPPGLMSASASAATAEPPEAGLAAWSIAHGLATLWISGAAGDLPADPDARSRAVLARLPPPK